MSYHSSERRFSASDVEFGESLGTRRAVSINPNPLGHLMDHVPPSSNETPDLADVGAYPPISSSDLVLGYPESTPPDVDLGPMPSGAGAKPSGKSNTAPPRLEPKVGRTPTPVAKRSGPPLPKRPKGRFFVGTTFLVVVSTLGYAAYNSLLRYSAYGEVTARKIELSVPWPGVVKSIHVREGDDVETGDLIAVIDSLEMRQKIEEIDDSLRLERAKLSSELAMLRWEAEKIRDTRQLSLSDFYDKWSELLWEQSRLADLKMQVKRIEPIHRQGAASEERLDSLRFQFAGQEKRVEQLTEAVRALKLRSDATPIELALDDRVKPTLARIENLQAELHRTRDIVRQGEIRAPANGRIVRTGRFVGEYADQVTPVAELCVEGSTELVLYLPQSVARDYPIGKTVTLHVNPIDANIACEVQRIAMAMQRAPESLSRHYRPKESLLPVYFRIKDARRAPRWLALGSEVRLPRSEQLSWPLNLKEWWNSDSGSVAPDTLRPVEPTTPLRTAGEQTETCDPADKPSLGHDGRMAGWILQL